MAKHALIAGGGIGGLSAALACSNAGWSVQLLEQAAAFSEVGAGIQLGPNGVKRLHAWGLMQGLSQVAAFPSCLEVKSAISGSVLGRLLLGKHAIERYGFPYATVHRADLHTLLLQALEHRGSIDLCLPQTVLSYRENPDGIELQTREGLSLYGDILIGADGLWSRVRSQMLNDGLPHFSGHLAYRALLSQDKLPVQCRSQKITIWLGPKLHLVQYPVNQGANLNVVAIVHGKLPSNLQNWSQMAVGSELVDALEDTCKAIKHLLEYVSQWSRWALCDRLPVKGAHEMARGRVALMGDSGHPMVPYLAQGAGMAIEDAYALEQVLLSEKSVNGTAATEIANLLALYASRRWKRCAQVQQRAKRNGKIFHMESPVRWARDAALKMFGERLLDLPWLYRG